MADREMLTREELGQINGEPVWVVWPDGRIKPQWWIVGSVNWIDMFWDDDGKISKDYGTVWEAYRSKLEKLSAVDAVEVQAIEKWLYEIAMNNVGQPVEDMAAACEIIISRLDGLRSFANCVGTEGRKCG